MGRDSAVGVTWIEERITGLEGEKVATGCAQAAALFEPAKQSVDTQAEGSELQTQ